MKPQKGRSQRSQTERAKRSRTIQVLVWFLKPHLWLSSTLPTNLAHGVLLGWRPSIVGWRPSHPSLVGWRPSLPQAWFIVLRPRFFHVLLACWPLAAHGRPSWLSGTEGPRSLSRWGIRLKSGPGRFGGGWTRSLVKLKSYIVHRIKLN